MVIFRQLGGRHGKAGGEHLGQNDQIGPPGQGRHPFAQLPAVGGRILPAEIGL
jgi:hypothetical protein